MSLSNIINNSGDNGYLCLVLILREIIQVFRYRDSHIKNLSLDSLDLVLKSRISVEIFQSFSTFMEKSLSFTLLKSISMVKVKSLSRVRLFATRGL